MKQYEVVAWANVGKEEGEVYSVSMTRDTYHDTPLVRALAAPKPVAAVQHDLDADLGRAIDQRDTAEGWADGLAALIGKHFGQDIGEHSSAHNPWQEAKDIIEEAGQISTVVEDLRATERQRDELLVFVKFVVSEWGHDGFGIELEDGDSSVIDRARVLIAKAQAAAATKGGGA